MLIMGTVLSLFDPFEAPAAKVPAAIPSAAEGQSCGSFYANSSSRRYNRTVAESHWPTKGVIGTSNDKSASIRSLNANSKRLKQPAKGGGGGDLAASANESLLSPLGKRAMHALSQTQRQSSRNDNANKQMQTNGCRFKLQQSISAEVAVAAASSSANVNKRQQQQQVQQLAPTTPQTNKNKDNSRSNARGPDAGAADGQQNNSSEEDGADDKEECKQTNRPPTDYLNQQQINHQNKITKNIHSVTDPDQKQNIKLKSSSDANHKSKTTITKETIIAPALSTTIDSKPQISSIINQDTSCSSKQKRTASTSSSSSSQGSETNNPMDYTLLNRQRGGGNGNPRANLINQQRVEALARQQQLNQNHAAYQSHHIRQQATATNSNNNNAKRRPSEQQADISSKFTGANPNNNKHQKWSKRQQKTNFTPAPINNNKQQNQVCDHDQVAANENRKLRQQQHQQQQKLNQQVANNRLPRNHRSLSTSSSFGSTGSSTSSSGSSSPSSSMLQIFPQRGQRYKRQQPHPGTTHDATSSLIYHADSLKSAASTDSSSPTSSASSTISSASYNSLSARHYEGHPLTLGPEGIIGLEAISHQHQQQQQRNLLLASDSNSPRDAALWALATQQPQLECLAPIAAYYPAPPPRPWLSRQQQQQQQKVKNQPLPSPTKLKPQKQKFNHLPGGASTMRQSPDVVHHNNHQRADIRQAPEFTVISYNVLADRLVNSEMFPSSPHIALNWFYRRELILRQLLEFNADIIALQELEMEQFETYFKPELSHFGQYEAIFEPKSRARYMDGNKRRRVDGCAIFFKQEKFKLVQRHLLEYNQIAMANAQGSEAMLNRVMTKDNIGLVAVLELIATGNGDNDINSFDEDESKDNDDDIEEDCDELINHCGRNRQQQRHRYNNNNFNINNINYNNNNNNMNYTDHLQDNNIKQKNYYESQKQQQPGRRILVCNTHIHWDPECCDVKLIQTIMLMNELKSLAKYYSDGQKTFNELAIDGDHLLPLVLLGDFNSMPNSGVTSYLTAGKITSLHKDFKSFRYTSCQNALALVGLKWQQHQQQVAAGNNQALETHPRRQSSPAWCFYPSSTTTTNNESPVIEETTTTSITGSGQEVFSYNHPFSDSIQLMGLLGPLDKNWLKGNRIKGLPQPHVPSDHLPLLVKLKLLPHNHTPPQNHIQSSSSLLSPSSQSSPVTRRLRHTGTSDTRRLQQTTTTSSICRIKQQEQSVRT